MPRQTSSQAALAGLLLALCAAHLTAPQSARAQGNAPATGSASATAPTAPSAPAPTTPTAPPPAAPRTATVPAAPPATASAAPPGGAPGTPASAASGDTLDLTAPAPTTAAVVDPNSNPYIPVYPVRRSGLVLGASGGLVMTSASGTRLKFSQRDQVADPGVAVGYGSLFFLGGALTDWFSFHLGGGFSEATKGDSLIKGTNFIIGVETWPLFYKGGHFQNLGLGLDFGTGTASITNKNDDTDVLANGGGFSMIRGSLFYEANPFWRLNVGPALSYEYRTTDTYDEHLFTLGARLVFYSGP